MISAVEIVCFSVNSRRKAASKSFHTDCGAVAVAMRFVNTTSNAEIQS